MRHITSTITGHHGNPDLEAAAFWVFGGIILLIAFGDAVAVLVAAVAILAAVAWIYRKIERRFERHDAPSAAVTQLHSEWFGRNDADEAHARALPHQPHAA
jgi:uncharacterized membrane protein YhiD involved in acid resistance